MCGTARGVLWVLPVCPEREATRVLAVDSALLPCLRCLSPDCGCLCVVLFNMPKVGSAAEEDSWGNGLRKQGAAGHVLSQTHLPFTKLRERE